MDTFKIRTGDLYFVKLEIFYDFFLGGGGLKFMDPNLPRKRLRFLHQVKISANRFNNDTVTELQNCQMGIVFL